MAFSEAELWGRTKPQGRTGHCLQEAILPKDRNCTLRSNRMKQGNKIAKGRKKREGGVKLKQKHSNTGEVMTKK